MRIIMEIKWKIRREVQKFIKVGRQSCHECGNRGYVKGKVVLPANKNKSGREILRMV
jgi:predicted nucleic-acid-binding Zn-ribbon protein